MSRVDSLVSSSLADDLVDLEDQHPGPLAGDRSSTPKRPKVSSAARSWPTAGESLTMSWSRTGTGRFTTRQRSAAEQAKMARPRVFDRSKPLRT